MRPAYRADHVGSFLRPTEILEARRGGQDSAELHALEDRAILDILAKQKDVGIDVFTDGELRRKNFMSDFTDAVSGFDVEDEVGRSWTGSGGAQASRITGIVVAKLKPLRPLTSEELPFLQAHRPGPLKVTLPSATQFPAIAYKRGITDRVYPDRSQLLRDIVAVLQAETARLAASGVEYIQIDAPRYSYYLDPKWREWMRAEMDADPDGALDEAIAADNACFDAARRDGVTLAIHLCRGNNRSNWYAEGAYDPIAEKLFGSLHVDRFLLEYDDARSGGFEPLRFVPPGKKVVLGLVSTKTTILEAPAQLLRRIDEAAKIVPLEDLALSPQCGFASTMEGNLLSEEQQWAKLRLTVETARRVWR
jgi:5-methyltetrahydropteroyltriglutamate--homocysteine methyltransferase